VDEPEKEQRLETELTYAWNWFQYHAGQRLTAFNFFLVMRSARVRGYLRSPTR
jgi:hypothetical protein